MRASSARKAARALLRGEAARRAKVAAGPVGSEAVVIIIILIMVRRIIMLVIIIIIIIMIMLIMTITGREARVPRCRSAH